MFGKKNREEEAELIFKKLEVSTRELIEKFKIHSEKKMLVTGLQASHGDSEKENMCMTTIALYNTAIAMNIDPQELMMTYQHKRYNLVNTLEEIIADEVN